MWKKFSMKSSFDFLNFKSTFLSGTLCITYFTWIWSSLDGLHDELGTVVDKWLHTYGIQYIYCCPIQSPSCALQDTWRNIDLCQLVNCNFSIKFIFISGVVWSKQCYTLRRLSRRCPDGQWCSSWNGAQDWLPQYSCNGLTIVMNWHSRQ